MLYNESDRRDQLERLLAALEQLIPVARELKLMQLVGYEAALVRARELATSTFTQQISWSYWKPSG